MSSIELVLLDIKPILFKINFEKLELFSEKLERISSKGSFFYGIETIL